MEEIVAEIACFQIPFIAGGVTTSAIWRPINAAFDTMTLTTICATLACEIVCVFRFYLYVASGIIHIELVIAILTTSRFVFLCHYSRLRKKKCISKRYLILLMIHTRKHANRLLLFFEIYIIVRIHNRNIYIWILLIDNEKQHGSDELLRKGRHRRRGRTQ
jgi:hypothetical protein